VELGILSQETDEGTLSKGIGDGGMEGESGELC
jgi:hypothetical protein